MTDVQIPQERQGFRTFLLVWSFMENLLFSGLRAGWPALVYVLKKEGIYQHLCDDVTSANASVTSLPVLCNQTYHNYSGSSPGISGLALKWVSLAQNGTNPGLFQTRFQYILAEMCRNMM